MIIATRPILVGDRAYDAGDQVTVGCEERLASLLADGAVRVVEDSPTPAVETAAVGPGRKRKTPSGA